MVVFYISGHGFGHASRDIEVMEALRRHLPGIAVIVRTAVPAWLFNSTDRPAFDIHRLETDSGLAQVDSLTIDERETIRRAVRYYDNFDERVAAEAAWLRSVGARIVVADVPPLACAAAARVAVPCVVLANFTWDWIYQGLDRFAADAPGVLGVIETAYAAATHALRLPLHGGFAPMADRVRDIPLVARHSRCGRSAARTALGIDDSRRPVVLASFGGHGVAMPYREATKDGRLLLLVTDFEADRNAEVTALSHVRCVTVRELLDKRLRYEDLVAAADVVVSKPGFGIVSECIANGTALLYTSRGQMAEYDVFVREMPKLMRCRFIAQEDLFAGRWADAVDALIAQPPAPTIAMTNGAEVAAQYILKLLR
jgi:hypothetical protein